MQILEPKLEFRGVGTSRRDTRRIIVHHTASADHPITTIHGWHLRKAGWLGVGYHYLIRRDGSVERGRPHHWQGAHTRNNNHDSIGIALTGNFMLEGPTMRQLDSLVSLIVLLFNKYGELAILGHGDVQPSLCPGENLILASIRAEVRREVAMKEVSSWAKEAQDFVKLYAISNGRNPKEAVTREEVWVMLHRLHKLCSIYKECSQ